MIKQDCNELIIHFNNYRNTDSEIGNEQKPYKQTKRSNDKKTICIQHILKSITN